VNCFPLPRFPVVFLRFLVLQTTTHSSPFFRSAGLADPQGPLTSEELRKRLVECVVCNDLPFSLVENPRFRSLLPPGTTAPSADTVKRDIMKLYEEGVSRIADRLCSADSKISVTLDCWTSPCTDAFMGITAHSIDDHWTLQSSLLNFVPLPDSHTGQDLCETFANTCERFGVLAKLLGITTDNASNINNFLVRFEGFCHSRGVSFDKEEQHVRCMAHITNLGAQALLRKLSASVEEADLSPEDSPTPAGPFSCVSRLRRLVVKIRTSPQRQSEFKAQRKACGLSGKGVISDTRTRWNSTPPWR